MSGFTRRGFNAGEEDGLIPAIFNGGLPNASVV